MNRDIQKYYDAQDVAKGLVSRLTEDRVWDSVRARDVPAEIINYVSKCLEDGMEAVQIRRTLGIKNSLDKSWSKIMSALRQGTRVDSALMFKRFILRNEAIANKLEKLIHDMLRESSEGEDSSNILKSYGKEVSMAVDSMNRLQHSVVKMGKELGVFGEMGQSGGQSMTIVVNNNIPSPTQEAIKDNTERKKQMDLVRGQGFEVKES